MFNVLNSTVLIAHSFIEKVLSDGGIGVDATVGNGNDTLFLAEQVGSSGKVYGFDIQEQAISVTSELISKNGLNNVTLFCTGHQDMNLYINEPVDVIIFNLGYLPGGDHSLVTCAESTLLAVKEGLKLLKPGGLMCVVVYVGHAGSSNEKLLLEDFLMKLDKKEFCVCKFDYFNRENAPYLILVEKNLK